MFCLYCRNMRPLTKYFKNIIKHERLFMNKTPYSNIIKPPWKVMFFGTDDFSVSSLKYLNTEFKRGDLISILEVVTSTKSKLNPVRTYAKQAKLVTHGWPATILDNKFDLGIVVSFGHLIPDDIINKFHLGIINVHASLLPRWRGAAPIIHTISNDDKKTGVTIMKIQPKKFDVGEIIAQEEVHVPENILMPDLYKQLADLGAFVLISSLKGFPQSLYNATPQSKHGITYAPKVTPNMARINWNCMSARQVFALARALYGLYPLSTNWNNTPVKLLDIQLFNESIEQNQSCLPGTVEYQKQSNRLLVKCFDHTWISCNKIGIFGKKPMSASDFNNGYLKKEIVKRRVFK